MLTKTTKKKNTFFFVALFWQHNFFFTFTLLDSFCFAFILFCIHFIRFSFSPSLSIDIHTHTQQWFPSQTNKKSINQNIHIYRVIWLIDWMICCCSAVVVSNRMDKVEKNPISLSHLLAYLLHLRSFQKKKKKIEMNLLMLTTHTHTSRTNKTKQIEEDIDPTRLIRAADMVKKNHRRCFFVFDHLASLLFFWFSFVFLHHLMWSTTTTTTTNVCFVLFTCCCVR